VRNESAGDIFEPERPVVPNDWDVLPFERAAQVVSDRGKRVKQSAYLPAGRVPIIDQGQDYIGGYTDDDTMFFDGQLPVVLFGDHTRTIKYVDKPFAVGAEGVKILRPADCYEPKFFYYLLQSLHIPSRGYSRHFQFLRKFHFPVAPKPQQKRIVAEIEKQFSRLDEAVANLKRVKGNLKRYKAAVLKAAVEGKLTEEWRKDHPDVEPASELLKHILAERRAKWEQSELAKIKAAGKEPKDDKWKKRYQEGLLPPTSTLSTLPSGWCWLTVDAIAFVTKLAGFEYTKYVKYEDDGDLAVIKAENAGKDGFKQTDFSHVKNGTVSHLERSRLLAGDLLMVFVGAGTGNVARVPGDQPYFLGPNIAMIRVETKLVLPEYLELFLRSPVGNRLALGFAKAVAQPSLSMGTIRMIPVAIPPFFEQRNIVAEVERLLSVTNESDAAVIVNYQRAERLRQSILGKAFCGRLISADGISCRPDNF
jgi:type I restriction enzyme S subunit